jgi:uncharacterized membrane protein YfcA
MNMDLNLILGYFLAIIVGITLGLMGSGGAILTIPILVYVMAIAPITATAYSLFIVGTTSMIGSIKNILDKNIDYQKVLVFGVPSIVVVFLTRLFLVPAIPENITTFGNFILTKSLALMVLFALIMIAAAFTMLQPQKENTELIAVKLNYYKLGLIVLSIGTIAGLVGAGGGFLIVPSLIILTKTPVKRAIATSLFIVAIQSLIGFAGDLQNDQVMDWELLVKFVAAAAIGIFIGLSWAKKIDSAQLKRSFGWFVLAMGIYIILNELLRNC